MNKGALGHEAVWFHLDCSDQPLAFLVLREQGTGATQTVPMRRRNDGHWEQRITLPAGRYRARCYAGEGDHVIYYGPARVTSGVGGRSTRLDGLDAVVDVAPPSAA